MLAVPNAVKQRFQVVDGMIGAVSREGIAIILPAFKGLDCVDLEARLFQVQPLCFQV